MSLWPFLAVAAGYLLGNLPFGLLVGKIFYKIDVRLHGSGNIGTTNIFRTIGPGPALAVLIGDAGKGALAVLLGWLAGNGAPEWMFLAGAAAIVGHNWPVVLGFKGGRGIATSLGVLITLMPTVTLLLLGIWLVVLALSRYVSLASIIAAMALPVALLFFPQPRIYTLGSLVLSAFALYKHLPNIKRLRAGKEFKLGQKISTDNQEK
ncbi:MAG: glycerol-3-phosphate 1-O-acyltransferase PlsY [Syntrophothermus sp.]